MTSPEPDAATTSRKRRIATVLLVAGVIAVVVLGARNRPVELTVRYDLSTQERAALQQFDVVWYLDDGDVALRTAFSYAESAAPREQPQEVSLPRGEYRVESFLRFKPDRVRRYSTRVTIDGDTDTLTVPVESRR